jgi:type VI secretion system protein ImpK
MVATFHRETVGGDRFYDLLSRLEQDPGGNIDLLEFMYMCLSLGFEGTAARRSGGRHTPPGDPHQPRRHHSCAARCGAEADLSPNWQGVNRPHRPLSAWRAVWIGTAALAACFWR